MSGKVMGMVFEANLPRVEKFVLLAIADHADDDGLGCYASEARIVFKTGYDLGYVQKTLKRLQERGVLAPVSMSADFDTSAWHINLMALEPQLPFEKWIETIWPAIFSKRSGHNPSTGNGAQESADDQPEGIEDAFDGHK